MVYPAYPVRVQLIVSTSWGTYTRSKASWPSCWSCWYQNILAQTLTPASTRSGRRSLPASTCSLSPRSRAWPRRSPAGRHGWLRSVRAPRGRCCTCGSITFSAALAQHGSKQAAVDARGSCGERRGPRSRFGAKGAEEAPWHWFGLATAAMAHAWPRRRAVARAGGRRLAGGVQPGRRRRWRRRRRRRRWRRRRRRWRRRRGRRQQQAVYRQNHSRAARLVRRAHHDEHECQAAARTRSARGLAGWHVAPGHPRRLVSGAVQRAVRVAAEQGLGRAPAAVQREPAGGEEEVEDDHEGAAARGGPGQAAVARDQASWQAGSPRQEEGRG